MQSTSRRAIGGNSYRGLDRSIYILFVARIINRFGDFVQMLLVLILTVSVGMDEHVAGLFTSLTVLAASLGQLCGGMVADRYPRRMVMVICQLAVAVLYAVCGFLARDGQAAIAFLILASSPFRGATWPVSNALIADFSEGEVDRARAFSLLYLGSNIGVAVGPMVAAFLFSKNLSLLFWGSAATLFVSACILGKFLPDKPLSIPESDNGAENRGSRTSVVGMLFGQPALLLYIIAFTWYNFIYVQHTFALPLQMNALFGTEAGTEGYGWIMTVNAVTVLVMTGTVTRFTIRFGRATNMAAGCWFYVAGFGLYAFSGSLPLFLAATFIWTIGEILLATNGNVFVNQHAPSTHRGRFNSVVSVLTGVGSSLGPFAGGLILRHVSYSVLWAVMVVIAAVISMLFMRLGTIVSRPESGFGPGESTEC